MQEINIREFYMGEALKEAEKARRKGEVPIGAVIVKGESIVAKGYNLTITSGNPTAHAEMEAIREAAESLGGWRLPECDMYVTVEPCAMCAGAIILARIRRVYIGTADPKSGACGSVLDLLSQEALNHRAKAVFGILEEDCTAVMRDFFKDLRKDKKEVVLKSACKDAKGKPVAIETDI
jgi:tRNA(adenine34) deaminase